MNTAFWSFGISTLSILGGVCFLCGALWLFIINIRRGRGAKGLFVLELFRLLIIALLVFTLFRPEFVRRARQIKDPLVAVLCDVSESMTTQDVVVEGSDVQGRDTWLSQQVAAPPWSMLEPRYKVVVEAFATTPKETSMATNAAQLSLADPGTDMNLALESAMNAHRDLRAILLLSDGDWNKGKSPVSAATRLCMKGIPVFAVAVGSDRFLPDLELQDVSAPAYGLMDEHISLPFTIQSRLPHDVKTSVTLRGPRGVEATKSILIPAMAQFQESLLFTPKTPGDFEFTLSLPVERDETFSDNNSRRFRMALRREVLKVLVVETSPRWEYRFLHNALARDPGVIVHCLLLHPGMAAGAGKDYLAAFPDNREALSSYDVVFLGDVGVGPGGLTPGNIEMLKGLVEQQGSGLVFLPGITGQQASLLSTPLAACRSSKSCASS
jgi:hypothetical protein